MASELRPSPPPTQVAVLGYRGYKGRSNKGSGIGGGVGTVDGIGSSEIGLRWMGNASNGLPEERGKLDFVLFIPRIFVAVLLLIDPRLHSTFQSFPACGSGEGPWPRPDGLQGERHGVGVQRRGEPPVLLWTQGDGMAI